MNLSEINWDLEYAGSWPMPVKWGVAIILALFLAGGWFYLDTGSQLEQLDVEVAKERELKTTLEMKQRKAANLEEYREQLSEIERTFGDLLKQLPNKTQVPELLVDVSQTGLSSGLEFELFKPGSEVIKDFYAELPIDVRVLGRYFDFGGFVSGLAALPRIVTVHNIKIMPVNPSQSAQKKGDRFPLVMSALVRTYRYLDEAEMMKKAKPGKPPAGKKP